MVEHQRVLCVCYTHCHSLVLFQNPDYMQEKFLIKIESLHLPDGGTTENVSYMFIICLMMSAVCIHSTQ